MTKPLPPGWAWSRLGDVATWGSGGTPKRTESSYYNGGIPWAVIGDLHDGVVQSCKNSITKAGLTNSNCKLLEPGTLLIAIYGSIGKLGVTGMPMATNQAIAFAVPYIDDQYLYNYLLYQRSELGAAGKGATQKNISQTVLKIWPIPIAPITEQGRIVDAIEEHFSHIDAVESDIDASLKKCELLIKSIIISAIPDSLLSDWQLISVAEAGDTSLGRQRSPSYHQGPNMKPYLRVANVFEDRIDTTDIMEMHFDKSDFEKYRLHSGDVLLNEGQSPELLGRPAIYRGHPEEVAFTNSLIRFAPKPSVTSEWALLVFRKHMHTLRFKQESRITTNIAHLSLGRFRMVEFPVPPLDVQNEIVNKTRSELSTIERYITQLQQVKAKIHILRHSVLTSAFSGRLVEQDPNDEPASVLLERIAAEQPRRRTRSKSA